MLLVQSWRKERKFIKQHWSCSHLLGYLVWHSHVIQKYFACFLTLLITFSAAVWLFTDFLFLFKMTVQDVYCNPKCCLVVKCFFRIHKNLNMPTLAWGALYPIKWTNIVWPIAMKISHLHVGNLYIVNVHDDWYCSILLLLPPNYSYMILSVAWIPSILFKHAVTACMEPNNSFNF